MGTQCLREVQKQLGGMLSRKILELQVSCVAILGRTDVLNQEHIRLCAHSRLVGPGGHTRSRHSVDTDSYTALFDFNMFYAFLFSIDNGTIGADNSLVQDLTWGTS